MRHRGLGRGGVSGGDVVRRHTENVIGEGSRLGGHEEADGEVGEGLDRHRDRVAYDDGAGGDRNGLRRRRRLLGDRFRFVLLRRRS